MLDESLVLCAASAYEKKFYLNDRFSSLPKAVKDELKIVCVLHTAEVGGILTIAFDEEGNLEFITDAKENDFFYDEIGSALKIKQIRETKRELWESLEQYFRVFCI
ncbi:MAG: DUF6145 family protein [Lachnospiraceae bacterium]